MQNIFIVTLGTREIQFNKNELNDFEISEKTKLKHKHSDVCINIIKNNNFENYIFPASPRNDGKIISDNFELFENIIQFPLIDNCIKKIQTDLKTKFNKFIIVFTDQKQLTDNNKNKHNDTLFYKEILKKHYSKEYYNTEFSEISIEKNIVNIDIQYKQFAKDLKNNLKIGDKDLNKIYLLPQGGIDQINHALTLQLLQQYRDNVEIWQQPEGKEAIHLEFTNLFLKDLLKQQLIALINNLDYSGAYQLCKQFKNLNKILFRIFDFAKKRKEMLYADTTKVFNKDEKNVPSFVDKFINKKYVTTQPLN